MDSAEQAMKAQLAALVEAVRGSHYDLAIAGLKEFLAAHPRHEIASGLLAASYFQIGMRDQARLLYEELIVLYPQNALARFQLGMLRLADDPREALLLWEPLLDGEDDFMAHFHSALARVQLGESLAAKPLLEHAAKYMPNSHPLRAQLERLRTVIDHDTGTAPRYPR